MDYLDDLERDLHRIEFVGGPLDGHSGWIAEEEVKLCAYRVGVAISRTLFECLHEGGSDRPEQPTSLAIYQRTSSPGKLRYDFSHQQAIAREESDATPLYLRQ